MTTNDAHNADIKKRVFNRISLGTQTSIMSDSSIHADEDSNSDDDSTNDSIITGT